MFLAFDTETSALVPPDKDFSQLRLIQIGAVMSDMHFREHSSMRLLVQPDGWTVAADAEAVHGLSTEHLNRYGLPLKVVLVTFIEMVKRARYVVSHNYEFDARIIDREIRGLGSDDIGLHRPRLRVLDTMKIGAAMSEDGRYPKLTDLYTKLTGGWIVVDHHDGLTDARAVLRCTRELVEMKAIEL